MIEIPLNSNPEQIFSVRLNGISYDLRIIYNLRGNLWTMSINSEELSLEGIALVSGVNLLKAFNTQLPPMYLVNIDNPKSDPNNDNLGSSARLFLVTEEEINNE